jgi:uncharacterized protein (TIGR03437 family)
MAQPPGPPANAPTYSAASIVNTASDTNDWFTPNAFVAIFGQNLANVTAGLTANETAGGILPAILPGTNLRVTVNGLAAYIYYVSPGMVNVLLPATLTAGPATIQLELNGINGPLVSINLRAVAPVVVTSDGTSVWGVHDDGTLITTAAPAMPGESIFLFASGLGQTTPPQLAGAVPGYASLIRNFTTFAVWINGAQLDPNLVGYAGILPGAAGVYEVVVTLPNPLPHNPEVRMSLGAAMSLPQTILNTQ